MITVKLHTALKRYYPHGDGSLQIQYKEGLTVKKILEQLNLNNGAVGLVLINGKIASGEIQLMRGDCVELFPIFGGG
ncbi:MoaD/ThiS family protein [Desulfofundulus salinus]|uniref:MoaD/ThiS family protein n=1 Tax=Desulfofundulus salinus TaxID=2419843 RepID=A0A494WXM8_9FIRM|nr:MoaD/ThiS family protein [Desulfofundulus salinum]RKO67901.1 MoaD/ThiS family protein [Desulfofundulus salinum]